MKKVPIYKRRKLLVIFLIAGSLLFLQSCAQILGQMIGGAIVSESNKPTPHNVDYGPTAKKIAAQNKTCNITLLGPNVHFQQFEYWDLHERGMASQEARIFHKVNDRPFQIKDFLNPMDQRPEEFEPRVHTLNLTQGTYNLESNLVRTFSDDSTITFNNFKCVAGLDLLLFVSSNKDFSGDKDRTSSENEAYHRAENPRKLRILDRKSRKLLWQKSLEKPEGPYTLDLAQFGGKK
ncbi:MAG: hypothetical protein QNL04_07395 [SAR324 cluster bacterium]|nr:hypothetical protein [SAR324 cluster bacterium]